MSVVTASAVTQARLARRPQQTELMPGAPAGAESFAIDVREGRVYRSVQLRSGSIARTQIALPADGASQDPAGAFDLGWLLASRRPELGAARHVVNVVDLFSGCGAMSLGVQEACRALGLAFRPVAALDVNAAALDVFAANFPGVIAIAKPIEDVLNGSFGGRLTEAERDLRSSIGRVHVALGGPPCQGNSDLNNHTRRADPKNSLFLKMARFAEVVEPEYIVIENVPGVVHDRGGVVSVTANAFRELGYAVEQMVLSASNYGVAQRRRRFLLVASRRPLEGFADALGFSQQSERTVRWAIGDLEMKRSDVETYDSAARHSADNLRRIDYLFENEIFDLPDAQRPDCHRLRNHTYRSVYGRLHWDEPAPTITGGFGSTGQGRFVHPSQHRTITPHEAARLQFIPDFFRFDGMRRGALQELIGNAVPPKLSYLAALELLR